MFPMICTCSATMDIGHHKLQMFVYIYQDYCCIFRVSFRSSKRRRLSIVFSCISTTSLLSVTMTQFQSSLEAPASRQSIAIFKIERCESHTGLPGPSKYMVARPALKKQKGRSVWAPRHVLESPTMYVLCMLTPNKNPQSFHPWFDGQTSIWFRFDTVRL